jgi:hypothetical protein
MPIRSRFLTPPAAPIPQLLVQAALNSRFIQNTPAPVSKFISPAVPSSPDDDPPPSPPTITPTKRRLHALWKARNFRKPFS